MPKAVRCTIHLSPELHRALRAKAALNRRSMSDVLNEALRQALREDKEDLDSVCARTGEKALSYEDFLAELKASGAL